MFRCAHIFAVVLLVFPVLTVAAQEATVAPRRTAEERAMKQTEMLVRELDIRDSMLRDTLFRVHLRYARSRDDVSSRAEAVERMNRLLGELKGILSPNQYERLQSIPHQHGARVHRAERDSLVLESTQPTP